MADLSKPDLCVIGGGQQGLVVARRAGENRPGRTKAGMPRWLPLPKRIL